MYQLSLVEVLIRQGDGTPPNDNTFKLLRLGVRVHSTHRSPIAMAPNGRIADFANRGLELETADSVEDLFRDLVDLKCIEKIVLTGNTFGVAAGEALGKLIRRMPNLKVSYLNFQFLQRSLICSLLL